MKTFFITAFMAFLALPASAQSVRDCDELPRVDAVAEPWESQMRTFAGSRVRIVVIDTLEPAAAAFQLVVLSPPFDQLGARQCKMVGSSGTLGFGGMTLDGMESSYDPNTGLTWAIPVNIYDPVSGGFGDDTLIVTLNQSTGAVTAAVK